MSISEQPHLGNSTIPMPPPVEHSSTLVARGQFFEILKTYQAIYDELKQISESHEYAAKLGQAEQIFGQISILSSNLGEETSSTLTKVRRQMKKMRQNHPPGPSQLLPSDLHKLSTLFSVSETRVINKNGMLFVPPTISKGVLIDWFMQRMETNIYEGVAIADFETDKIWDFPIPCSTVIALHKKPKHKENLRSFHNPKTTELSRLPVFLTSWYSYEKSDPRDKETATINTIKAELDPQIWGYVKYELYTTDDLLKKGLQLDKAINADIILLQYKQVALPEIVT